MKKILVAFAFLIFSITCQAQVTHESYLNMPRGAETFVYLDRDSSFVFESAQAEPKPARQVEVQWTSTGATVRDAGLIYRFWISNKEIVQYVVYKDEEIVDYWTK